MSLVVVRCPGCRGESHAAAEALGQTVGCPRCGEGFVAAEEAEVVAPPGGPRLPAAPPPPGPGRPRPFPVLPPPEAGDDDEDDEDDGDDEPDHDPTPPGGLPASVLIGLALLPFAIPILWAVGPAVIGQVPTLSLAVPLALAVSASVLCLAVIYTIDWSPPTRIKGVLLLVVLAYLAGTGLYFLRKETVERVRKAFGAGPEWAAFQHPRGDFRVNMPGRPVPVQQAEQPVPGAQLGCFKASDRAPTGSIVYVAGAGRMKPDPNGNGPAPGTAPWYDALEAEIVTKSGGRREGGPKDVTLDGLTGREVVIKLDAGDTRVVRVFHHNGRRYYLSAEGAGLTPGDEAAAAFFDSFEVAAAKD